MAPLKNLSLRRSHRVSSVALTTSDYCISDLGTTGLITYGTTLIKSLINIAKKNGNARLETKFAEIRKIFRQLEKKESENQKELDDMTKQISSLEQKIMKHECARNELQNNHDSLKHTIGDKLNQLPTIDDIQTIVKAAIAEASCPRGGSLSLPVSEKEPDSRPEPQIPTTSQVKKQKQRSSSPALDRIHKRTIILRGAHTKLNSKEIQNILSKDNTSTASAIEKIIHRKNHIEITCSSQDSAETLKREMQQNNALNRELVFLTKTAISHKMILLSVPPQYTEQHIKEAIQRKYIAYDDEIQFLAAQKSKKNPTTKDWIMVLPRSLGKSTIRGNGITLGFHTCKIRPHTSVQRCNRCQAFDHPTKHCVNNRYCPICGERSPGHEPRNCDKIPSCVNCHFNNEEEGTRYPTDHRASDSCCPVFHNTYRAERERLDNIFVLQQRPENQTPYNDQDQQSHADHHPGGPPPQWSLPWLGPSQPMFSHWPLPAQETAFQQFQYADRRSGNYNSHHRTSITRQLVPEKDTDQSNMPSLDSSTKLPKLTKRDSWDLKGRIQDMEDNIYTTQEQNEYLKQELEACNMRISSLESVNSLLHHDNEIKAVISEEAIIQIDELESQLKKKTEEAEKLQKEICILKQEIANGKKEYDNLKMMYGQETGYMKSTITNLTFLKSSIEAQLDATKLMLFTLETEINQLKMKCSDKDAEIKSLKEHNKEIESKLREEESLRRKLHNTIQELKGNIRVFCRMRPALSEEIKNGMNLLNVVAVTDKTIEIQHVTDIGHLTESAGKMQLKYEFSFDCYFPPYTSQEKVFSEISQLVQSALDGYNVCIFAYGQTGSGKTYTMEGPADILDFVANKNNPKLGMIPRSVSQIFSTIEKLHLKGWKYRVEALFLEIYNERIRDLLNSQGGNSKCDILKSGNRGTDCVLSNVTTSEVTSCEQVYELMRKARMNRAVAATKCNEYSSRSHYVFQMKIYGENSVTGEKCESTLNLVDLAGSERLKDSESVGERLNEAKAINKSLSNLGKVIMSLSRKESYIPYRDSKLTHLLANSLGGNCKTLMFVNISPDNKNLCETLNSLRFATKVNKCDIGTAHKRIK